jgi:hypothetical protein
MKKQTYEGWVTAFVERLSDYFNLSGWIINVVYSDADKGDTYATADISSPYQFVTLTMYKKSKEDFDSGDPAMLVLAIVHEIVHILLDPFHAWIHPHLSLTTTPLFMDILEQQTQKITMVFLKTLPKKLVPSR